MLQAVRVAAALRPFVIGDFAGNLCNQSSFLVVIEHLSGVIRTHIVIQVKVSNALCYMKVEPFLQISCFIAKNCANAHVVHSKSISSAPLDRKTGPLCRLGTGNTASGYPMVVR